MGDSVVVTALPPCDFCRMGIVPRTKDALYDGKTRQGPWANMCEQHFEQYGVGLGTGKGQRLVLRGCETCGPDCGGPEAGCECSTCPKAGRPSESTARPVAP